MRHHLIFLLFFDLCKNGGLSAFYANIGQLNKIDVFWPKSQNVKFALPVF